MRGAVLLDTGPLVAFLDRRDACHAWAVRVFDASRPPLLTCEAAISEACFLLRGTMDGVSQVMALLTKGVIATPFRLQEELQPVADLMVRYENIPMSLADACLVRMAEQYPDSVVVTLDSDFRLYRKHRRRVIPTIIPDLDA